MTDEQTTLEDRIREASEHHRAGRLGEAARLYRLVLDEDPSRARVWSMLGHVYSQAGSDVRARECFERAVEVAPDQFLFHFMLGGTRRRTGDLRGAAASFAEACRIQPDHLESHEALIAALEALGESEARERAAGSLARALPDDAGEADRIAEERRHQRRWRDALILSERAVELDDSGAQRWHRLAALRDRYGDSLGAFEAERRAFEIDPAMPGVASSVVARCERLGMLDDARWYAGAALERDPGDPELTIALARLDRREGNLPVARARLGALRSSPRLTSRWTFARAATELGRTLDATGRFAEAFASFSEAQRALLERSAATRLDPREYQEWIRAIEARLEPGLTDRWHAVTSDADPEGAPIFVVGWPGSGLGSVGAVLSRMPGLGVIERTEPLARLAQRASEMLGGRPPLPDVLGELSDEQVASLRATYAELAADASVVSPGPGEPRAAPTRTVEVSAANLDRLALVRRVFPEASVVEVLRDPRDACLSAYFQMKVPSAASIGLHTIEGAAGVIASLASMDRVQASVLGQSRIRARFEHLAAGDEREIGELARRLGVELADPSALGGAVDLDELPPDRWTGYSLHLEAVRSVLDPIAERAVGESFGMRAE